MMDEQKYLRQLCTRNKQVSEWNLNIQGRRNVLIDRFTILGIRDTLLFAKVPLFR